MKEEHYYKYRIDGSIMAFNEVCVDKIVNAQTSAVSEKKAINNILYKWKKNHNHGPQSKYSFIGNVEVIYQYY